MHNERGFTMIELIAVMIIISVLTAVVIPKIIDLESSAERKLIGAVIAELNAREKFAFLDYKLGSEYTPIKRDDLMGITLVGKNDTKMELIFDGGAAHPVYRIDYDENNAGKWYEGKFKKPKPPKPPKKK